MSLSADHNGESLPLPVARTVADLRAAVAGWRRAGESVGLVPTMGALHDGHLSLVGIARAKADRVVASIFVNPTQFGPREDLDKYPRDERADAEKLAAADVDLLFAPTVVEMYPPGFSTTVSVSGISEGLCGNHRPGHFDGVATVVSKLLLQCLPDVAVFGEKDYQQLQVIKRFVRDLNLPTRIIGGPTVREADGLALSSRNAYLGAERRAVAAHLPQILNGTAATIASGQVPVELALKQGIAALTSAGFDRVEYLELRDPDTLEPLSTLDRPARLLVAAHLGSTRLIDNVAVDRGEL
jgi:pantoate--beta-alanine ligase